MPLQKATSLDGIFAAFDPAPLTISEVSGDFYVPEVNLTRGSDRIEQLALSLSRAHGKSFSKAFVMGHAGVGISTELTRLESEIAGKFRVLRLSANTDFDPVNFRPFDVILRIALNIAERTAQPVEKGGAGARIADELVRKVLDWFAAEKVTVNTDYDVSLSGKAVAGPGSDSWWAKLLGLYANISAEAKTSSGRSKEVIEYRDKRIIELLSLANEVLDACNTLLRANTGLDWLVIGDDFDKPGIPPDRLKDFFITYGNIIRDLHVHLILDLPVSLGHSSVSNSLPRNFGKPHIFPDTPVYQQDHTPHVKGRKAIRRIIETRANLTLFGKGQAERLIVASGGNLRDLFGLIFESATHAALRSSGPRSIQLADVNPALALYRKTYRDQLGSSNYDQEIVTFEDKLKKLIAVYKGTPGSDVPDPVLYSLLHARAIQEFNGDFWYGLHPLTVDFLDRFKDEADLAPLRDPGTSLLPGGTL